VIGYVIVIGHAIVAVHVNAHVGVILPGDRDRFQSVNGSHHGHGIVPVHGHEER
jgi:hypothetical protein